MQAKEFDRPDMYRRAALIYYRRTARRLPYKVRKSIANKRLKAACVCLS